MSEVTHRSPPLRQPTSERVGEPEGSVVENAVRQIRKLLVDGRFEPGQKLALSRLSKELGISVMPIREALRRLEGEGLVNFHPNRGAIVRPVNRVFLQDLYEVRAALQEVALRRAVSRITFAKAQLLRDLCRIYEQTIETDDIVAIIAANRAVHIAIFEIADNRHALRLFDRDWEIVQTLRLKFGYLSGRTQAINTEQRALVEAIVQRDAPLAISIMHMHNSAGLEDLIAGFGA